MNPNARAGFTLIELSITIFVIGLMAALAYPVVGTLTHRHLKQSALELATAVKVAYAASAVDRAPYRLAYEMGTGEYYLQNRQVSGETAEWKECDCARGFTQRRKLKSGVRFKEIDTMHAEETVKKGDTFSQLTGNGFMEPTVLHLIDERQEELTLQVMPMTGAVRIFDGYVKFKK